MVSWYCEVRDVKFIVVIIHKINYYNIIWEDNFIDGNEFRTQNSIIETLNLLGLKQGQDYICDLCFKYKESDNNE